MSVDDPHAPDRTSSSGPPPASPRGRRWRRTVVLLVAVGAWVWFCFVWLFPWLTELGLDPTLGG